MNLKVANLLFAFCVLVVVVLIYVVVVWFLNINKKSTKFLFDSGTNFYYFDIKTRKIKTIPTKFILKPFFKNMEFKGWQKINKILQNFKKQEELFRALAEIYNNLEKGSKKEILTFKEYSGPKEKTLVIFKFVFHQIYDDSNYSLAFSWKTINQTKEKELKKSFSKSKIANLKSAFKGFVVFSLNGEKTNLIIRAATKIYKGSFEYFVTSNILVFVFLSKQKRNIQKKINSFVQNLKKRGFFVESNNFLGGASVWLPGINSSKSLNKVIQLLFFLMSKSQEKNKFITFDKSKFNEEKFSLFLHNSRIFKNSMRINSMVPNLILIKSRKTNKTILKYLFQKVEGIDKKYLLKILKNKSYKKIFLDKQANWILKKENTTPSIAIDVLPGWLIRNKENVDSKEITYVINALAEEEQDLLELKEASAILKDKNFFVGLKVFNLNDETTTLINLVQPSIVVVDENIWFNKTKEKEIILMNLIALKKICRAKKIKIIYQNPPKTLDERDTQKIGLDFFFVS